MATAHQTRSTIDDLMKIEGKAELIGGKIMRFMPTGRIPNRVAGQIYRSLADHAERVGDGEAFTDGVGYAVPELASGRESFCPDASYFSGPFPDNPMRFLEGPPRFAVEVRSDGDYGPAAERAIASKRNDYFEAGTSVVWDVDPKSQVITTYRADQPGDPRTFRRGDIADAESAVGGWRVPVDRLFS